MSAKGELAELSSLIEQSINNSNALQNNLYQQIVQLMKRPQSAKPGYRGPAAQNLSDDVREQELPNYKHQGSRKPVKLLKPDLTTNDFARIMPKKIFQDKERLYSQGLQLKQKLNEFEQENTRLKTRISILEKEKDKLTRAIDVAADPSNKSQSRFKMYQGPSKPTDAENTRVRNLTKIVRQCREENDYLRQQNTKIKKAVKFTKINEVEIQCKILREEYQKLEELLVEMNEKLSDQEDYEKEISELKKYLEEEVEQNKQLAEANQKYVEYIDELQEKLKKQADKFKQKQNKLQREIALNKRKLNQEIRISDDLRKELRTLKQSSQNLQNKKRPITAKNSIARPMSSVPFAKPENKLTQHTKIEQMKQRNQKLEKQLKEVKQKLEKSQKQNQQSEAKNSQQKHDKKSQKLISNENQKHHDPGALRVDSEPQQNYDEDFDAQFVITNQKNKQPQNKKGGNFVLEQQKKAAPQDEYFEQFQENKQEAQSPKKNSSSKIPIDSHIQNYNKDLQDDAQEEELYKKDSDKNIKDKEKKKKKLQKPESATHKANKGASHGSINYEPDKKMLTDIKQLLTYRMKAQRYPYQDLKNDILASKEEKFTYNDLEAMMKTEPFYLTPKYTQSFLEYVFEKKQKVKAEEFISTELLLNKLKKVIKNFELLDQKEEEERLMSIAEMTTQYPNELESAFEKIKNGPDTVAKKDLIEMFKKLELADHFIEIIIAELSLCSDDLDHLSIRGYFQRFYIDEIEGSNAIDEEQIQSSGEQKGNSKSNLNKGSKIQKIDEEDEYEEDKANFVLDEKMGLPSKSKIKNVDYNDDMVSDDGHI